jgi:tetratricopeptide (TPR) repeat protein
LGQLKDQQGEMDAAIDYYRQVLGLFPDYFPALERLGAILLTRGDADEAGTLLARAGAVSPADENVALSAAQALVAAERRDEAKQVLRRALNADPHLTAARNRLARLLKEEQSHEEALKLLREGLKLDPGQLELSANLATTLMGSFDPHNLRLAEATAIMERVCERTDHRNAGFLHVLSRAYVRQARFDDAIATAERAHELALSAGQTPMADAIAADIALYRQTQATTVVPPTDSPAPEADPAGEPKQAEDDD